MGSAVCRTAAAEREAEILQDRIRLRITAYAESDVPAIKNRLKRLHGTEITEFKETIFVLLPVKRVEQAASLRTIERIGLPRGGSEPAQTGDKKP